MVIFYYNSFRGDINMDNKRVKRRGRITRLERFKIKQRKRRRITLVIFCVLIAVGGFLTKEVIAYKKCQDISSAVEYYMTSNIDEALLRVQNMELKFSDGSTAVVEASGLSKEKPHESKKVECHLIKNNNSWKLENLYTLN